MTTRAPRIVRVVAARTRTARERLRHRAELRAGRALPAREDRVPVFILGAPRSGTTLLYQLLVEGLDVGYLANAHMCSPGSVARIERERHPRASRGLQSFRSSFGATSEPWEPSEAGPYWYRFVPREPHELVDADLTAATVEGVRASVRVFADACAAPLVLKNVFNSLRVPLLASALPEARFLVVRRDTADTARSLLRGRAQHGGVESWMSARPLGAEDLAGHAPAEQVVWQIEQINRVAERELRRCAPGRWRDVSYEALCADPRGMLNELHEWLAETEAQVELRADAQVPRSFPRRPSSAHDAAAEAALSRAMQSPIELETP